MSGPLRIVDFEPRHAAAFRALNLAWIEPLLGVEDADRRQLDDPRGAILEPGGAILVIEDETSVVGVCALVRLDAERFELAKMTIDAARRGSGLGRQLLAAAIRRARERGARRLELLSNRALAAAIHLYREQGFEEVPASRARRDARCDVAFELALPPPRAMPAAAALELIRSLERAGVDVWLDGGWAVDAALGEATRPHGDLDVIVETRHLGTLRRRLAERGFTQQPGGTPSNFVLDDGAGLELDVHAIAFAANGDGLYTTASGGTWVFPARGFAGRGTIEGEPVRCLTPEIQVHCHAHGYVPSEKDFRDMERLHARFGVALPRHLRRPSRRAVTEARDTRSR